MFANAGKITIMYEWLLRDADEAAVSSSIVNQQKLLEELAEHDELPPYEHLTDDGFTGANFNRPGWPELIVRAECGEASAVRLKDSSRMGSGYLRVDL
ncbi:MAG: hypothetical protein LBT62_04610 [Deltaproteobacteria bacterium]|jgi:hypothetical protein|nr:hypothetical protein [Deltaproteobacteria bacterium]